MKKLKKLTALLLTLAALMGLCVIPASAASAPLANDNYAVETKLGNDSMLVNVLFAGGAGSKMGLDYHSAEANEILRFELVSGTDIYRITPNHNTSLALRGDMARGAQATVGTYDGSKAYWWKVIPENGCYKLRNCKSGYYLTVKNGSTAVGTALVMENAQIGDNQKFNIFPADPGHLLAPDSIYEILAAGSQMGVNVQFAPTSGIGKLCLDSTSNHEKNEQFIMRYNSTYKAYSLHPVYRQDTAINALYGASATAGSQAVTHPYTVNDTASLWYLSRCGKNYRFRNVANPSLYLDIAYGGRSAGTRINLWTDDYKNQCYTMRYVSAASASTTPVVTPVVTPTVNTSMTNVLYGINISGSKLTCGFDGYVTLRQTKGYRHEGIDFQYQRGQGGHTVYSLTDGVVTRVTEGLPGLGKGHLSTITIKYGDKSIVYLHTDPTVSEGQTVKRGDPIALESNRGADNYHSHVEVRSSIYNGAATSSDSVLVNSNPTSFWQSLGYSVK